MKSPGAGHLADIRTIFQFIGHTKVFLNYFPDPFPGHERKNRLVAPISTVLFVPKDIETLSKPSHLPETPNLPTDRHWTDVAQPGSVVIMQVWKPDGHPDIVSGLLGDIVGTRYKKRGIKGVIVDGRSRDVQGVNRLGEAGDFQAWTRGLTSVGTGEPMKVYSCGGFV